MKILFVENHATFASTVTNQFLAHDIVTVVPSLSAARDAMKRASFDLALVDYDLEDGKGDELVRELSDRSIRVIGVSSHNEGNAALLRAGAVAVCDKMHLDQIQNVINIVARRVEATADGMLWWVIPGALAGMPMPFIHPQRRLNMGGSLASFDDELPALYQAGIRAVVSLLNLASDSSVYESAGFSFKCLPVPDGGAPTMEQAREFVDFVDSELSNNRPVAVHCEAGLGRTGTMLAVYLISKGESAGSAVKRVREAENSAVETIRQILFLEQFAAETRP